MTRSSSLAQVAPAFIETAHRIAWACVATVDDRNRPRTRILHPLWRFDGTSLSGVIATGPTPAKIADLAHSPYMSVHYWDPTHDVCRADCHVTWEENVEERVAVWSEFKNTPPPAGYDPSLIPGWEAGPTSPAFAVLRLRPFRLRVFPGSVLSSREGDVLTWSES